MTKARVLQSGNSQVVLLPKGFRFKSDQVEIFWRGNDVVLREMPASAASIFDALAGLPVDLMDEERVDSPPQKR
jgi:antitoxin VapB